MRISVDYEPNASKRLVEAIVGAINDEFGAFLPFPSWVVEEEFPLYPKVQPVNKKNKVAVQVADRTIYVEDRGVQCAESDWRGSRWHVRLVPTPTKGFGGTNQLRLSRYADRRADAMAAMIEAIYIAARTQRHIERGRREAGLRGKFSRDLTGAWSRLGRR